MIQPKTLSHDDIVRKTRVGIGQKLPNGTTLLMEKSTRESQLSPDSSNFITIVLAVTTGFQPFITWARVREATEMGDGEIPENIVDYCVQGHYFSDLAPAMVDFETRR